MFCPAVELGFVTSEEIEFVLSVDSAFVTSAVELDFVSSAVELDFVSSAVELDFVSSAELNFVTSAVAVSYTHLTLPTILLV